MSSTSAHVSVLSIVFMCVTAVICFGGPIGLAFWMKARHKPAFSFMPLLAGVLGFFISQIVIRQPVFQLALPQFGWYRAFMRMQWPFGLFLSLTAGLVEEPARFIAFAIMKKRRSLYDGLSYGIGHGGIEAMLVVGVSYVGNIIMSIMVNTGALTGSALPAPVLSGLAGMPPYIFLVAGLERIFAVSLQVALSLVVLKGFQANRKALYLTAAILVHGAADFLALAATTLGTKAMPGSPLLGGVLFAESLLAVIAVLSVLYIRKQASAWRSLPGPVAIPPQSANLGRNQP